MSDAANRPGLCGENIVFIVGSPRSGTTWLQRLLATHPQIKTGQESRIFEYVGALAGYGGRTRPRPKPAAAAAPAWPVISPPRNFWPPRNICLILCWPICSTIYGRATFF